MKTSLSSNLKKVNECKILMVDNSYLHMRLLRILLTAEHLPLVCLMIPRDVVNTITLFYATEVTFLKDDHKVEIKH